MNKQRTIARQLEVRADGHLEYSPKAKELLFMITKKC